MSLEVEEFVGPKLDINSIRLHRIITVIWKEKSGKKT
jgi:hypothetical protein